MHEVLISYSKDDKKWADAACSVLEARGIRCWIAPRDIVPGTEWGAAIIAGIDACKVMVLIFSASANASPQVRREVERAISKGLTVVPCRIEDVTPVGAMEFALSNTHWLDVFTPPIERQMNRLAESVQALLRDATNSGDGPLASPSTMRKEDRSESDISRSNPRGKYGLIAGAGLTLIVLLAGIVAVVFWPHTDAASSTQTMAAATDKPPVQPGPAQSRPVESQAFPPSELGNDGFVRLFNGKDLTGWEQRGNAKVHWKVENGILKGDWPPGADAYGGANLDSIKSDYQNFRFRIETKLCRSWPSAMTFLYQVDPATGRLSVGWYQAVIGTHARAPGRAALKTAYLRVPGSTQVLAVPRDPVRLDKDQWFSQEVVVEGKHIRIYVNDVLRTDYEAKELPRPGHVGIHLTGGSSMSIREIKIKELSPKSASTEAAAGR